MQRRMDICSMRTRKRRRHKIHQCNYIVLMNSRGIFEFSVRYVVHGARACLEWNICPFGAETANNFKQQLAWVWKVTLIFFLSAAGYMKLRRMGHIQIFFTLYAPQRSFFSDFFGIFTYLQTSWGIYIDNYSPMPRFLPSAGHGDTFFSLYAPNAI